jgi:glyoxylase-like metal-dependent hydrolase (beta-lactamase superfamily II)
MVLPSSLAKDGCISSQPRRLLHFALRQAANAFPSRIPKRQFHLPAFKSGRSISVPAQSGGGRIGPGDNEKFFIKTMEERMTQNVSRRSLLALGAGLGATALLGGSALARAPKLGTQTPYWHRFILGGAEVTVVSDGPLPLGDPSGTFIGVPKEEVKKMLTDNFLSPDNVVLEQNSPIVNTGDKLVLFDTGMGTLKLFGPTTGRQQKSMAEAGIKPEEIDAVVLSHAHIDHIGGIVDSADKVLFPNAQFYIAQSDFDFWTDESKVGGPLKDFVLHARKNLLPVRDRLVFFKDGQEILPGIQAMAAPGHTVGHTIFMVTSEGKSFAFLGDLTHHAILLLEKPRMEFSYDTDPKQAANTRVKLLDMIAANKIPVMSYHFAWPGYGHVVKTGEGFHYIAEPMIMTL